MDISAAPVPDHMDTDEALSQPVDGNPSKGEGQQEDLAAEAGPSGQARACSGNVPVSAPSATAAAARPQRSAAPEHAQQARELKVQQHGIRWLSATATFALHVLLQRMCVPYPCMERIRLR